MGMSSASTKVIRRTCIPLAGRGIPGPTLVLVLRVLECRTDVLRLILCTPPRCICVRLLNNTSSEFEYSFARTKVTAAWKLSFGKASRRMRSTIAAVAMG